MSLTGQTVQAPLIGELEKELAECKKLAGETPLVNPYQQLSRRVLRRMKDGDLPSDRIDGVISDLRANGFQCRARRARNYLAETSADKNGESLKGLFRQLAEGRSFAEFNALAGREIAGIVITGHPTFGFSSAQYEVLAGLIDGSLNNGEGLDRVRAVSGRPDEGLSLDYEFACSERALLNLQEAIASLYEIIAETAREAYPADWKALDLRLVTAASWVGFDVDGRDDITWLTSVQFRLRMALEQSRSYLNRWRALDLPGGEKAGILLGELEGLFENDLAMVPASERDEKAVRAFARHLVETRAGQGDIMYRIADELDVLLAATGEPDTAQGLFVLRALFANFRTGFSHLHFRLNAVQLHNAIRPLVALEKDPDDATSRRRYMTAASRLLEQMETKTIGFENILHEQTTAKRLFMIIAQFLKYIDSETPVRFLIAESDTPFTVLAALCFARMFGVEDKVDISPLFETDQALMRGAEVISELLENPHYYAYVKKRGRLCVQAGYSDAGRYLGQVAAGLAIERLRIKLAGLWSKFDLEGVELVMFDTGGESLGRGAHPDGFDGRLSYMHSPEARRQIEKRGIAYKQEFSLQGGDGYLWLHTPQLALATLSRVMENLLSPVDQSPDPFYENTDWSLDFFLTVKGFNLQNSDNPDFMQMVSMLGANISYPSGSRMTLRQDEGVIGRSLEKLSRIRAIPNNMLLQQLGFLANSVGGMGMAVFQDGHGFWKMYERSPRLRHIFMLVMAASDLTDDDFLGAYDSLFRPRYWMHLARSEAESRDHDRMLRLAKMMQRHGIYEGLNRMELTLREDLMYLRDGIKDRIVEAAPCMLEDEERSHYALLHVLRMALIQKMFMLITRIPRFRDHKGLGVDDLVLRILKFQVEPTLALLREIFPLEGSYELDPENPEKITYKGDDAHGYEYENREIFDEIARAFAQIRDISQALSAYVGAFG